MAKHRELKVTVQHSRGRCYCPKMLEKETRRIVGAMMSTRLANTLRITIKVRDKNYSGRGHNLRGSHGLAVVKNLEDQKTKSKKYVVYLTKDRSQASLLDTLAHELCHVHQMAQGRLRVIRKGGVKFWAWRGEGKKKLYSMDSDYYSQPWEVEAREAGRTYR